ncbi:MAG: histidine phosphatase family protein [Actinobacteria bacterium]|nr:MAG: histidine phosphatase family protein [Actinomycetota bacterium]
MAERKPHVVLVRHGETEWSADGRHTGRTDIPLTDEGRRQATALGGCLKEWTFALVLASPLQRATETCRLAGLGGAMQIRGDLREWDYGEFEGRTTADIRTARPGWTVWTDGVPGGETAHQVGRRADRMIAEARAATGEVALFSHGHILRVLAARWIDLAPDRGRSLALETATISVLGYERETSVITRWNVPCG